MEGRVAMPSRMENRPVLLAESRIMSLHAEIEPQKEIIEVKTYGKPVGRGKLLVKFAKLEETVRLVGIILDGPDVAYVEKGAKLHHPEELGTVFGRHLEPYVAALLQEVGNRIGSGERAGTESTHRPTPHTVGTTAIEAFFERHDGGVAVRVTYAEERLESHGITPIEDMKQGELPLSAHILRIWDSKHLVGGLLEVVVRTENIAQRKEKIARYLRIDPDRISVFLESALPGHLVALVGMIERIAKTHDEVVFIAVSQKGIVGGYLVDEIVGGLGEIHIVDVYRSEHVTVALERFGKPIIPAQCRDDARIFGPLLIVDRDIEIRCGVDTPLE